MTLPRARGRHASRHVVARILVVAAALAGPPTARADTLADVQALYYGGRTAEAMRRADEGLAANAGDPPLRFMKGVMLTDAGRRTEATAVFLKLTEDYPDLAEPYNNLATLYASAGRYDQARAALDQALRVNPSYATALENLGDVYAALAAQAYGRAIRLDPANRTAPGKLESARKVYRHGDGAAAPAAAASTPPSP